MNHQIAHRLDGIELCNRALNDVCHALIVISTSNMTAKELRAVIKPLAEGMGDWIDESNKQVYEIEKILTDLADAPLSEVQA